MGHRKHRPAKRKRSKKEMTPAQIAILTGIIDIIASVLSAWIISKVL